MDTLPRPRQIALGLYAQHCARAGALAMDGRTDAADDPGWDSDDVAVVRGSRENLLAYASLIERTARRGGNATYDRRRADAIRGALAD